MTSFMTFHPILSFFFLFCGRIRLGFGCRFPSALDRFFPATHDDFFPLNFFLGFFRRISPTPAAVEYRRDRKVAYDALYSNGTD